MDAHVRNSRGEHKTMSWEELKHFNKSNPQEKYEIDVEWYLSHGYITLEEMNRRLDKAIKGILENR